jgi:adenylate cyclase
VLAAIMFTDMVDFSLLSQRDERLALELVEEQRQIIRAALPACGGREVKSVGDGLMVVFASALEAVRCSIEIQTAVGARNRAATPERRFQIRIGIHVGDVVERDGDLLGDGVNIAARVEPLAPAGGILVTRAVYDQVRNKVAGQFVRLGRPAIKNIRTPLEVYVVALPGDRPAAVRRAAKVRSRSSGWVVGAVLGSAVAIAGVGWVFRGHADGSGRAARRAGSGQIRSLLVLPLKNFSGEAEQRYFAAGLSDSLTTDLTHISALRVLSYQTAQEYAEKSVQEIGRVLQVDAVLEGSVQKLGHTVVINAQLIDTATDAHLWGRTYSEDARDLFRAQGEIVAAVADAVRVQLKDEEKSRIASRRRVNRDALAHYYNGLYQLGLAGEAGPTQAIKEFEKALAADAAFAPAYAGLADAYSSLSSWYRAPREVMPKAEAAARRAIALDPNLAEAHSAMGYLQLAYHWNRDESEKELRRAIALNPNYARALTNYGCLLISDGRYGEALAKLKHALDLEPRSAATSDLIAWDYLVSGHYDLAIDAGNHTLAISPQMYSEYSTIGLAYLYKGDKKRALAFLKKAADLSPTTGPITFRVAGLASAGRREEARQTLQRLIARSRGHYVCAYEVATGYEAMGDRKAALAWLQKGYDEKCDCLIWAGVEPWMADIRKDPRFKSVLAQAGLLQ